MSGEAELRRLMLHAADKLTAARDLTVVCTQAHEPRRLALPVEFYVASTYAETVLRMLAASLKVEDQAQGNGHRPVTVDPDLAERNAAIVAAMREPGAVKAHVAERFGISPRRVTQLMEAAEA
jgi:hypothetical protein